MMWSQRKINLGCGAVFVDVPSWLNLDFAPVSPKVRKANLLGRLPVADSSATLVYSSHFLEHVPHDLVPGLFRECYRVLHSGGVIRLVLPDFENMAQEYLAMRAAGAHENADFVILEIIDQCVRREPGGELGRFYRALYSQPFEEVSEMVNYIRLRTGEDLRSLEDGVTRRGWRCILRGVRYRIERLWIRMCLLALPSAFRMQNVSLAAVGERHQWLWDFHQVRSALEAAGFVEVYRASAEQSRVADFPFYPLDIDLDGHPRKGVGSMYVEANKP